jgi:hypothetical protein
MGGGPCFAGEARHQAESYKRAFVIAGTPDENWFHKSFPRVQKADLGGGRCAAGAGRPGASLPRRDRAARNQDRVQSLVTSGEGRVAGSESPVATLELVSKSGLGKGTASEPALSEAEGCRQNSPKMRALAPEGAFLNPRK